MIVVRYGGGGGVEMVVVMVGGGVVEGLEEAAQEQESWADITRIARQRQLWLVASAKRLVRVGRLPDAAVAELACAGQDCLHAGCNSPALCRHSAAPQE
ncbi:hypothetical protein Dda_7170 [Drechslerella dactyloides]|uniref:Uncharacterized protein n=1 Tax=Drechslerella dactyloides TaxID=74499 RepID=A0AAD6NG34_DREDA|nr:hypothetical protein Dda_7170 [Drechslerella dactyloides]